MTKRIRTPEAIQRAAKRKEENDFFRKLAIVIHMEVNHINFSVIGPFDHHYLDGIYILLHNRVVKEYAYPEDRLDQLSTPTPIPEDILTRLFAFLEDCAMSKAAFYRRDWLGFVWEVLDASAYAQCCQRHGFSETDYQNLWLREFYDDSGRQIKRNS